MGYTVLEELFLTADGRLVGNGDPDGKWVYARPGAVLDDDDCEKFGLSPDAQPADPEPEAELEPEAAPEPPAAVEASSEEPAAPAVKSKKRGRVSPKPSEAEMPAVQDDFKVEAKGSFTPPTDKE